MPRPQISLKARALKYLSSREHSRLELARKLTPYAQDGDDIEALLNWLQESKFLSQERFSESLVNRRVGRYGNNRILSELKSHGITGEALGDAKIGLTQGENERAREVLRRKFDEAPADGMGFCSSADFRIGQFRPRSKPPGVMVSTMILIE